MFKNIKYIIINIEIIILCITIASCSIKVQKEKEDNNNIYTANIINNKVIKGKIDEINDIDFYRIVYNKKNNKDIIVDISCTENEYLDIRINLYKDGKIVKIIDDTGKKNKNNDKTGNSELEIVKLFKKSINNITGNKGKKSSFKGEKIKNAIFKNNEIMNNTAVFSIEGSFVQGFNKNNSHYELSVNIREKEDNQEGEPNDKPVYASEFINTNIMNGYFSPSFCYILPYEKIISETDWYSFKVEGDKMKLFNISHSSVPGINSRLSVYDELGYLIREANSRGNGEAEKLALLGLKKGKYFIKLESVEFQKNEKIGYSLKLESIPVSGKEYEPNDKYPYANHVSFGNDIAGYFNPSEDIDWFRFNIYDPFPQVVSIKVSPAAGIDPVIELCTVSGEPIITVDDRGIDEGEIIRNIGVREGVYHIKLRNKDPMVDNADNNYLMVVEKNPWDDDEEFEKNNTPETANSLVVGGLKNGFITPREDRDFYSFVLEEASDIVFELTPCILMDPSIRVYDQDEALIKYINTNGFEQGEKEIIFLEKGLYYIEIFAKGSQENSRDAYILRIYRNSSL